MFWKGIECDLNVWIIDFTTTRIFSLSIRRCFFEKKADNFQLLFVWICLNLYTSSVRNYNLLFCCPSCHCRSQSSSRLWGEIAAHTTLSERNHSKISLRIGRSVARLQQCTGTRSKVVIFTLTSSSPSAAVATGAVTIERQRHPKSWRGRSSCFKQQI